MLLIVYKEDIVVVKLPAGGVACSAMHLICLLFVNLFVLCVLFLLSLVFNSHGRRENALHTQTALLDRRTGVCVCVFKECVCVCVCVCVCEAGREGGELKENREREDGLMGNTANITSVMGFDSEHLLK